MSNPTDRNLSAVPDDAPDLAKLQEEYPAWWIGRGPFSGYRAEWKSQDGATIRYIGGNDLPDLARRLEVIEAARAESAS